jgi:hypothetical protein
MFLSLELAYSEDFGPVAQANTLSMSPLFTKVAFPFSKDATLESAQGAFAYGLRYHSTLETTHEIAC